MFFKQKAEGLVRCMVSSKEEIKAKIEQGVTNRSISATNMNENSSRSHMIITITLKQRSINSKGNEETKTSVINLVDLAGRSDSFSLLIEIEKISN